MTTRIVTPNLDWPAIDQQLWQQALTPKNLLEEGGRGAILRPASLEIYSAGNGAWLAFLGNSGELDPDQRPSGRVTPDRLIRYVEALRSRVAPRTVLNYVSGLHCAIRLMEPKAIASDLDIMVRNLKRLSRPSRSDRHLLCPPQKLYDAGLRRMRTHAGRVAQNKKSAMAYQDGLMMALLVAKPIRLKNLVAIRVGQHLNKGWDGVYSIAFDGRETKEWKNINARLPLDLSPRIDFWLTERNWLLTDSKTAEALWITSRGTILRKADARNRFKSATLAELGKPINPHFVRKIVATGIAIWHPEMVKLVPSLLDHSSDSMEKDVYNLADNLSASIPYLELIKRRSEIAFKRMEEK